MHKRKVLCVLIRILITPVRAYMNISFVDALCFTLFVYSAHVVLNA